MRRVDSLMLRAKTRLQFGFRRAVNRMTGKLSGDSQIVVALVLIAVAAGLCIIFRNKIYDIMESLVDTISKAVTDLSSGSITGSGE